MSTGGGELESAGGGTESLGSVALPYQHDVPKRITFRWGQMVTGQQAGKE